MSEKKYRSLYADHCIRHPNDHVTYTTFRWRARTRGEKTAVRLGKREMASEVVKKIVKVNKARKSMHLNQKKAREEKSRNEKIKLAILCLALFGLGLTIGMSL